MSAAELTVSVNLASAGIAVVRLLRIYDLVYALFQLADMSDIVPLNTKTPTSCKAAVPR